MPTTSGHFRRLGRLEIQQVPAPRLLLADGVLELAQALLGQASLAQLLDALSHHLPRVVHQQTSAGRAVALAHPILARSWQDASRLPSAPLVAFPSRPSRFGINHPEMAKRGNNRGLLFRWTWMHSWTLSVPCTLNRQPGKLLAVRDPASLRCPAFVHPHPFLNYSICCHVYS